MTMFVNMSLFLCNLEYVIGKRVKQLYNYLSFNGELYRMCRITCKGKYKMNNYHLSGTNLMRICHP